MKYTPEYFPFDELTHKADNLKMLLMVAGVYILIFSVAWVLSKLPDK
jgi:hypothetical protein